MPFQTKNDPPIDNQGGGGTPPIEDPKFHEQIHGLIEDGSSLEDIHKAIAEHPDMHSKEFFKEYAALMHKSYTDYSSKMKGEKAKKPDAKDNTQRNSK